MDILKKAMVQVNLAQKNKQQNMKEVNSFEDKTQNMITIKGIIGLIMSQIDEDDVHNNKEVISLGMGDPTAYSCFTTTRVAEEAVVDALSSTKFNGYAPTQGLPQTRK